MKETSNKRLRCIVVVVCVNCGCSVGVVGLNGSEIVSSFDAHGLGKCVPYCSVTGWEVLMYDTRQKECSKHVAAALISTAYRAPHLSLCMCQTSRKCAVL